MDGAVELKSEKEIGIMKIGGAILKSVMSELLLMSKPGISLRTLDMHAEKLITESGAIPSFKKVKGYHWSICTCVNDIVVHGIPTDYLLTERDVIGIDCGVYYKGFHTDSSWSVRVRNDNSRPKDEVDTFLAIGEVALRKGIAKVKEGNFIYDISKAIQEEVESHGYGVVRSLIGHGVGRNLHEEPEVPGYVKGEREKTPKITPGLVLAIEVIYTMGKPDVVYKGSDEWTIVTKDGKMAGLFEATVAQTAHGALVLT
ncbi:type I methionyl aminopeptidase [Candidatus Gottesmanbacteria bacterium]|nr:type I methionyl aminopeptidase [Candidatus Gottesmanbacteria bacterium]